MGAAFYIGYSPNIGLGGDSSCWTEFLFALLYMRRCGRVQWVERPVWSSGHVSQCAGRFPLHVPARLRARLQWKVVWGHGRVWRWGDVSVRVYQSAGRISLRVSNRICPAPLLEPVHRSASHSIRWSIHLTLYCLHDGRSVYIEYHGQSCMLFIFVVSK